MTIKLPRVLNGDRRKEGLKLFGIACPNSDCTGLHMPHETKCRKCKRRFDSVIAVVEDNPAQSGEIISPDKELVQCHPHGIFGCQKCKYEPHTHPDVFDHLTDAMMYAFAASLQVPGHMIFHGKKEDRTETVFSGKAILTIGVDMGEEDESNS